MSESHSSDFVEYRPIPNALGYRAGTDGAIWSCWRPRRLGYARGAVRVLSDRWKQLRGYPRKEDGRLRYTIKTLDGSYRRTYGAILVLEAFVGPCPAGMECCHSDGNCLNDARSNLRWDTPTANKADMVTHGTRLTGENVAGSKLSNAQADNIKRRVAAGESMRLLAIEFGVTLQAIWYNAKRKRKAYA